MSFRAFALATLVLAAAWLGPAAGARSEGYPTKPITVVVPFSAGGPTDTVTRLVAQYMSQALGGSPIVVENVPGAGSTIGVARVDRASADGYTLLLNHIGMATTMTLYRKLDYDSVKGFEPIGLVTDVPKTLIARRDLPPDDLKSLIAYLKEKKDAVTYANAGIGAASHLCGMLLMSAIETPLTTVPYKGTAPAMNDLLGGQVDLLCDQTTNTTSQIQADKVKVYGVTSQARVPSLPKLPTLAEAGLPGFEVTIWHGLFAPKGTPPEVIAKLAEALRSALREPTVKERFAQLGTEPVSQERATPEALRAHLQAEIDRWRPVITASGQYAE
jgi:tripartite-type tricarboxylate transporter receptor subunit TctC